MIDFSQADELDLLRETSRSFADEQLRGREREHETKRQIHGAVRRVLDEIGLAHVELPEALGGADLGPMARAIVLEELGACDAGAALALDPLGPALYPLLELAGEASLRELAEPLLSQSGARAALAWRPDLTLPTEGEVVSLTLPWYPADRVDLLLVLGPAGAFAVREGIETSALRGSGLRAAGAVAVELRRAPVAAAWQNPEGAQRALARARLYLAALLTGVMRDAADFSRQYAMERVAFGRPIAHHQALAFLIVDMASAVEAVRALVLEAAWRLESGRDASEPAASAFVEAIEQSLFVTSNGVQILGGHGFMQDYPVEKRMREARALGLLLGGIDAAREDAARAIVDREAPALALVAS